MRFPSPSRWSAAQPSGYAGSAVQSRTARGQMRLRCAEGWQSPTIARVLEDGSHLREQRERPRRLKNQATLPRTRCNRVDSLRPASFLWTTKGTVLCLQLALGCAELDRASPPHPHLRAYASANRSLEFARTDQTQDRFDTSCGIPDDACEIA